MLNLYQIFHINLMYSSIQIEDQAKVINNCYHPLLDLAERGVPIGIEISGLSLELIANLDSRWTDRFRELLKEGKVELIGSGYSQIIGPIVPAEVNHYNQKIGCKIYQEFLNQQPTIALVNEMAFSAGLVEHYLNNGYKAVIMEYNNPSRFHPEWDQNYRYYPQNIRGTGKAVLKLVWSDSIAFQKFQRYVHTDISFEEYEKYLETHLSGSSHRYFPIYSGDAEIFDFRPGRYKTEEPISGFNEWKRITDLFDYLSNQRDYSFVFPSELIEITGSRSTYNLLSLESPEQPIPVKKQEKYNINRWTLSGRNDLKINTQCYEIYSYLKNENITSLDQWKELCFLWSSDFRTHITEKRWKLFEARLQKFCKRRSHKAIKDESGQPIQINDLTFSFNELQVKQNDRLLEIINGEGVLKLNKKKGLAIDSYTKKDISDKNLFGTLGHGYFDDISFGADFFSGHSIIERTGKHKITDLTASEYNISYKGTNLLIDSETISENVVMNKKITMSPHSLIIEKMIILRNREPEIIRPMHFTFNPEAFDKETLYYATNNGGNELEYFKFQHSNIKHHAILSPLISSKHGLGATTGKVIIGDNNKTISFKHDPTKSALIPSLEFQQFRGGRFFLRLVYSAQEIDETFKSHDAEYSILSKVEITITAGKN